MYGQHQCLFCRADEPERDEQGRIQCLPDEVRATLVCSIPEHREFAVEQVGALMPAV